MDTENGFVKLRRGAREHLGRIGSHGWFLFSYLLFIADFRKGPRCGIAEVNFKGAATELKLSTRAVRRALAALRKLGYVVVLHRGNQHADSVIRVEKYDSAPAKDGLSVDSAPAKYATSSDVQRPKSICAAAKIDFAPSTNGRSTLVSPNRIKASEPPKNLRIEEVKSKKEASTKMYEVQSTLTLAGALWKAVGIGTLPESFQPFVSLAEGIRPGRDSLAKWGQKVLTACKKKHVHYPSFFLKSIKDAERRRDNRPLIPLPAGTTLREMTLRQKKADVGLSPSELAEWERLKQSFGR